MAAPAEESKLMESEVFKARYRKIKTVGKGSFGEAVLVRSKQDGKRYIVKAIESASMSPKEKRDVQNEIRILSALNHPNIVRYHEHFEDGTIIFIAMEYADGGDLSTRIKEAKKQEPLKPFDPQLAMFWFLQVCMALKYLHDNHILHRDLKTANIFLTSKNIVKLGDFGISTVLQNTLACAKTVCGTPYYFSPELCKSVPYTNKSDIWALGVVFYETLTLQRPFNAKSLKELLKKILVGQYEPIPTTVPGEIRALCASLLQVNPVQRPSVNRILESPYVQECLKGFSTDLEEQAARDKAEYEATAKAAPPSSAQAATTPAAPAAATPAAPAVSDRDQMAALRGMNRGDMRAMLAQQAAQPASAPTAAAAPAEVGHAEIDDDGAYVAQKRAIAAQSRDMLGKAALGGHAEEFGDAGAAGAAAGSAVETITLANGETLPANQVRGRLEKEMGAALLNRALEYVSDVMAGVNAPSNAEIQRELGALVGVTFAHNANAITKLAVFEGKQ